MTRHEDSLIDRLRSVGDRRRQTFDTGDESMARLLDRAAKQAPLGGAPSGDRSRDRMAAVALSASGIASGLAGFAPSPANDAMGLPLRTIVQEFMAPIVDAPERLQETLDEKARRAFHAIQQGSR